MDLISRAWTNLAPPGALRQPCRKRANAGLMLANALKGIE
jgi:hypothetical protein